MGWGDWGEGRGRRRGGCVWEMGECVGNGGVEEGCEGGWENFVGGKRCRGIKI